MNLNGPGTSLFQGNDLSNFDNLAEREEEEEAIEEQKRRDLELKNMLENAFDDVSFDNDDGSVCNGTQNHSSSGHSLLHSNTHPEIVPDVLNEIPFNADLNKRNSNNNIETFNTPLKHTRSNHIRKVDFNNESENYSDQNRKKIHNGSLHDIIDASGGGDAPSSLHYNHCFQKNPLDELICNGVSNSKDNVEMMPNLENALDSSEQLKILYDIRVREVHRLTELIDSMRNKHEIEIKELKQQLAIMLAESERANISYTQLQSLLVASQQQAEELLSNVKALEKTNKELETSKSELVMELEAAKLTVDDLQRRIIVYEKGNRSNSEAVQYELNLKSLSEKHNNEIMNMKKELDNYIKKNDVLFKENEELKIKISNLSQLNDENLAKKSEIINRLSKQIDETQSQCENLMKSSTAEENFRLQTELKMLKEEKTFLALKIENLEKENIRQEEEIKQYESLSKISSFSGSFSDSKEFESSDVNGKLGAELYRALNSQKAKRQEIKNLQSQLNEKNDQISSFVDKEKILKMEVQTLKEEINQHLIKIKSHENIILLKQEEFTKLQKAFQNMEKELKEPQEELKKRYKEIERENECLQNKIQELESENKKKISEYGEEYMRFCAEELGKVREETEQYFKLEILKKDIEIENLKKELEDIKNLYVEVYSAKENLLTQLEKEKENSGKSSAVDLEEVKKLQRDLEKSRQRILELDQTLKQQYQQEVEILNLNINQLNLEVEKLKKEKDREVADREKIVVENDLLKSEIEHATSEKNLLFLDCEKLHKEIEELRKSAEELKETSKDELKKMVEKHEFEMKNLSNNYEMMLKKLTKELESTLTKNVTTESKYTSPMKSGSDNAQRSTAFVDTSTSPIRNLFVQDSSTSPISAQKKSRRRSILKESLSLRDISVLTDPEPVKVPKKDVIEIMEKLGAHHEEEIKTLESKYRVELVKLDKKFKMELEKAKEKIRRELQKEQMKEIERIEEKHRTELENRIEQERKEAVVDLITEWACEVQSLKASYAEAQQETEKMKLKYKAAKSMALQYKAYFKSKTEHMKEEWKKIENGYEQALKELEKNVHILVDVKEDEVQAKVDSIAKVYEQKINKMKEKLSKCEERLKAEIENGNKKEEIKSKEKFDLRRELEKLTIPEGNLLPKPSSARKEKKKDLLRYYGRLSDDCILNEVKTEDLAAFLRREKVEHVAKSGKIQKKKYESRSASKEESSDKDRTSR